VRSAQCFPDGALATATYVQNYLIKQSWTQEQAAACIVAADDGEETAGEPIEEGQPIETEGEPIEEGQPIDEDQARQLRRYHNVAKGASGMKNKHQFKKYMRNAGYKPVKGSKRTEWQKGSSQVNFLKKRGHGNGIKVSQTTPTRNGGTKTKVFANHKFKKMVKKPCHGVC